MMNILIVFEIPFKYWHKVVWEEIGNITRLSLEQSVLPARWHKRCQVLNAFTIVVCRAWIPYEKNRTIQGIGCIYFFKYCFWREGKAWLWRKNRPYFISMDRIITVWMLPNSPLPSGCTHCTPGIIPGWLRTTSQHNIYTSTHWWDLRLSRWPPWAK